MPSLRSRKALPLTLSVALASVLSGGALLSAQAEPVENLGRSRAPVSHGDVSSRAETPLGTASSRSKAPLSLQGEETTGIETGNARSRAPISTP